MANWNGLILTDTGRTLQAKVEAGQTLLTLTKFKLGNGIISGSQTLEGLTDLISPKQTIGISTCTPQENGLCEITGTITNAGLSKGYELRELGIFANDPSAGEILYAVTTDQNPDYLQADGGATVVSEEFNLNIAISNTKNVTAIINPVGLATISNIETLINKHNTDKNTHQEAFTAHNTDQAAHAAAFTAHNTDPAAHASGISGNAATATRLKPTLTGTRNQCWLLCKLPKNANALVHYKILGAQYYDQYSTLEVVVKNGFGWCKYVGRSTNYQVSVKAYDNGTTIDVYLFVPGYCDIWEVFLQKNNAVTEFSYKKVGDATYKPAGTLALDTATGLGCSGVELFNAKSSTGESVGHIGLTISNIPDGCLTLDTGALVSRATYSELWAFVQSSRNLLPVVTDTQWQTMADSQTSVAAFSTGDGSTTFRLPKLLGWAKGGVRADVGDTHEAGLPNIKGVVSGRGAEGYYDQSTGAFTLNLKQGVTVNTTNSATLTGYNDFYFDASKSNAIYGASTEVQPAGFVGVYYIRVFHGTTNQGNVDITALANEKADTSLSNINAAGKERIVNSVISGSGDRYVKFANGTLIQYGIIPATVMGGYADLTYPISFLTGTQIALSIATAGTAPLSTGYNWGINIISNSRFLAYPLGAAISGSTYIAIGKWK